MSTSSTHETRSAPPSSDRYLPEDRGRLVTDSIRGVTVALGILGAWAVSLTFWLTRDLSLATWWYVPAGVPLQTFLYTGLFITAHDAMHGGVAPANRKLNDAIGALAVGVYALFSYRKLHEAHWAHHDHAGRAGADPDFHDGESPTFWSWYLNFLRNYISIAQIVGMAVVFNLLLHLVGLPEENLLFFWVAPALLSTIQLFVFGTWLPHRERGEDWRDGHRARSNAYPVWLSFLTCYHFGYHWEHHEFPYVPWWRLPRVRRSEGEGVDS
jgi:beta-carotene ketolase (CrtW type)